MAPALLLASAAPVRAAGQAAVIAFHCTNTLLFGVTGIGAFGFVMCLSLAVFPTGLVGCAPAPHPPPPPPPPPSIHDSSAPATPRLAGARPGKLQPAAELPRQRAQLSTLLGLGYLGCHVAVLGYLACHVAVQTVVPLRQFRRLLDPGPGPGPGPGGGGGGGGGFPVAWTKQHDRFSWRMKSTVDALAVYIPAATSPLSPPGSFHQVALCELLLYSWLRLGLTDPSQGSWLLPVPHTPPNLLRAPPPPPLSFSRTPLSPLASSSAVCPRSLSRMLMLCV